MHLRIDPDRRAHHPAVPDCRSLALCLHHTAKPITPDRDEDKPRVETECTLDWVHSIAVHVGVFARRNARKWRTAIETRSFGSFHGKKVIWAFGASSAVSSATA